MKKEFCLWTFIIVALFTLPQEGAAAPFLVCDPYPASVEQPDSFEITVVPLAPFLVPAVSFGDGSVGIRYDLATLANLGAGTHTATAVAIKDGWRSAASQPTSPFVKPNLLSPPNLRLVSQ